MGFYDNFLNEKSKYNLGDFSNKFENSKIEDFNSGQNEYKFVEIEIYQIK